MNLVRKPDVGERRPLRPECGSRANLFIYLIASVPHRLCLQEAKTQIGLVNFVALIYLGGGRRNIGRQCRKE